MVFILRRSMQGKIPSALLLIALTMGCGNSKTEVAEEPQLFTPQQCKNEGGVVVGDIGDGRTHQPGYKCQNGSSPIGRIDFSGESVIMVEGAVCCPE